MEAAAPERGLSRDELGLLTKTAVQIQLELSKIDNLDERQAEDQV